MRSTIYLNLDGVCQPLETPYYLLRGLRHVGPLPFSWVEPLQPVIEAWDADVVLRSTATTVHGLDAVKGLAPDWLRPRIVGATSDVVRFLTLFEIRKVNSAWGVIWRHVQENGIVHWVALDDKADGWPATPEVRKHLVQCDGAVGLSDPMAIKRLNLALAECRP